MTRSDAKKAQFHWDDPLLLNNQLSDDERMIRDAAAAYCQDKLAPRQAGPTHPRSVPPRAHGYDDFPRNG
jgi:hypothetical protein